VKQDPGTVPHSEFTFLYLQKRLQQVPTVIFAVSHCSPKSSRPFPQKTGVKVKDIVIVKLPVIEKELVIETDEVQELVHEFDPELDPELEVEVVQLLLVLGL